MRILCIGFGNVARELARVLLAKGPDSAVVSDLNLQFVGVTTSMHGSLENAQGIDLLRAIHEIEDSGHFKPSNPDVSTIGSLEAVRDLDYEVLVELSTLSLRERGEPAATYLRTALKRGKHCVTANKGPIAFAYQELEALARISSSRLLFESTVMDGAPVFNLARNALLGCRVLAVEGIVNSTSNYVLTQLEKGSTLKRAIRGAQESGFAEADPSHDLEGWDAAAKICILARVLMGAEMTPNEVVRQGFSALDPDDFRPEVTGGTRVKMVASAVRESGRVRAEVVFKRFPPHHSFAGVQGTGNILRIETDLMCPLTIRQEAPTIRDSAYGVLNDLLELRRVGPGR